MKKFYFFVAAVLMTLSSTTFTSCTSDTDDFNSSEAENNQFASGHDGMYSFQQLNSGEAVSVQIQGNNATVSRAAFATGEPNAVVVFENDWKGHLMMKDNTLGVDQIPFVISTEMLELDLNNANVMAGNSVVLKKSNTAVLTRGGGNDDDAYLSGEGKGLLSSITQGLIKFGAHSAFGSFGDAMSAPLLSFFFAAGDKNAAQFQKIENQMQSINARLDKVCDMYQMNDLKTRQQQHWEEINTIKAHNDHYTDLLNHNPNDKDQILEEYAKATINKSEFISSLAVSLRKYAGEDDVDWFTTLDDYYIRTNAFLEQSYAYRDMYRLEDLKVFAESFDLSMQYLKSKNIASEDCRLYSNLYSAFNTYYDAFMKNAIKTKITRMAVCTIPGALFVAHKTIGVKAFGANVNWEHEEYSDHVIKDNPGTDYWDRDGAWINSYVFSRDPLSDKNTELRSQCLSRAEAEAIMGYYGGKRELINILNEEGGMNRIDNSAKGMLLSDFTNADWLEHSTVFNDEVRVDIAVSRWDYKKNSYLDNALQNIIFDAHCQLKNLSFNQWYCFSYNDEISLNFTYKQQTFSSPDNMLEYVHKTEACATEE